MIEHYNETNDTERLDFARKAAKFFEDRPECVSFSENGPKKGGLMAFRWGLGADCVLVFRVSDDYDEKIMLYPQLIDREAAHLATEFERGGMEALRAARLKTTE